MSFICRYVGISEAAAVDGRRMLGLMGFEPAFLSFASFPVDWPVTLVGVFEADSTEEPTREGQPFTVAAYVSPVDRSPIAAHIGQGTFEARPYPDVPPRIQIIIPFNLKLDGPTDLEISLSVTVDQDTAMGRRRVYVRQTR